jgi:hypothetical protein
MPIKEGNSGEGTEKGDLVRWHIWGREQINILAEWVTCNSRHLGGGVRRIVVSEQPWQKKLV